MSLWIVDELYEHMLENEHAEGVLEAVAEQEDQQQRSVFSVLLHHHELQRVSVCVVCDG